MPATTRRPFVDFRAIRARLTMEQVLEHYGVLGTFTRNGNRLSGPCPIHGGSNATQFRVETDKNIWKCFSECANGGNTLDFIAKKENVSIHESALKACEWFNIPLGDIKSEKPSAMQSGTTAAQENTEAAKTVPVSAPPEEDATPNPPLKFRLEKLDRAHPYFAERGLSQETVMDFGLGYFTGERGLMVGRIAIPIHNAKGEIVAYAGRLVSGTASTEQPKYKLPNGFRKSLELFNLDRASKERTNTPLVIVEGYFDCMKLHQHGCRKVVALMGCTLSPAQEELIRKHTNYHSQVVIALDEDKAGQAGRDDIACRLSRFCFVKVHQFEKPGMQPEQLSADEVADLLL